MASLANITPDICDYNSYNLNYYEHVIESTDGDSLDQCVTDYLDKLYIATLKEEGKLTTAATSDVAATRLEIERVLRDMPPQHIEITISARNESRGIANLSSLAWVTVFVGGGHDFRIKMNLVSEDANINPADYSNLTYQSAPWDKLSPTEAQSILAWWDTGKFAILTLEDNDADELESPHFLFGDPPGDDVSVTARDLSDEIWKDWADWLRPIIAMLLLALIAGSALLVRRVYQRRTHIKDAFFGPPDKPAMPP